MTDVDLEAVIAQSVGVSLDLLDRDGPPLFDAPAECSFCGDATRHGRRGDSCPIRLVPLAELCRDDLPAWLRRERGLVS